MFYQIAGFVLFCLNFFIYCVLDVVNQYNNVDTKDEKIVTITLGFLLPFSTFFSFLLIFIVLRKHKIILESIIKQNESDSSI